MATNEDSQGETAAADEGQAKRKTTKKSRATKAPETVVYIGPPDVRRNLVTGRVYREGVPELFVSGLERQAPQLRALFVPVSRMPGARAAVQSGDTALARAYRRTASDLNIR